MLTRSLTNYSFSPSARILLAVLTFIAVGCDAPVDADDIDDADTDSLEDTDTLSDDLDPPSLDGDFAVDEDLDPVEIGAWGYWSWGTPGNLGVPLDLGPDNDRTCFLQGVSGQIRAPQWTAPASQSRVRVYRQGGRWWLQTLAGDGAGAMGHATCIPVTTNRRSFSWGGNTGNGFGASENKNWITANANTQCFLTEVRGNVGWGSPSSFTRLARETLWLNGTPTSTWTLGGNLLKQQDNSSGGGSAAVCVDIAQNTSAYSWQSFAAGGQTATLTGQSNVTCSVLQVSGNFAHNSLGWNDGARVFPEGGSWKVFSSNGKGIKGACLFNP